MPTQNSHSTFSVTIQKDEGHWEDPSNVDTRQKQANGAKMWITDDDGGGDDFSYIFYYLSLCSSALKKNSELQHYDMSPFQIHAIHSGPANSFSIFQRQRG
jgi:hypothetical protein